MVNFSQLKRANLHAMYQISLMVYFQSVRASLQTNIEFRKNVISRKKKEIVISNLQNEKIQEVIINF